MNDTHCTVGRKHNPDTALQDKLIGALIGLARVTDGNEYLITPASTSIIVETLYSLASLTVDSAAALYTRVVDQKRNMVPDCFSCASPCGKNSDYDMSTLQTVQDDIRALKYAILYTIQEIAACAYPAAVLGYHDSEVDNFFYKALIVIGMDDYKTEDLLPILQEADTEKQKSIALLGNATTKTSGES